MDDRLNELELLLLAVQQGALNDGQVEELLRELEDGPARTKSISVLAVERGFISEGRLQELASARKGGAESTVTGGDVVMACATCGKEQKLSLAAALRRPPCKECSGSLAYRRPAGGSGRRTTDCHRRSSLAVTCWFACRHPSPGR